MSPLSKASQNGFTLLEMLIALALTAVVSTVLFSTWRFTASHSLWIRRSVIERETERILPGILDADIAGLMQLQDAQGRPLLPPISRVPMDSLHPPVREKAVREAETEDEILIAFPTSTSLMQENPQPVAAPVCVEYVLRPLPGGKALVRRERAFCGVPGEFPWEELVLTRNLREVEMAGLYPDQGYVLEWKEGMQLPLAVRFRLFRQEDATPWIELLAPLPQQKIQVNTWR